MRRGAHNVVQRAKLFHIPVNFLLLPVAPKLAKSEQAGGQDEYESQKYKHV